MPHTPIHVSPRENSGDWDVIREGEEKPLSTHPNQASAETAGAEQARADRAELKIHHRDGSLQALRARTDRFQPDSSDG